MINSNPVELAPWSGDIRDLILVSALVFLLVITGVYMSSSPDTSLVLPETAELKSIDDNRLGTVIVRNKGLPRLYSHPGSEICLYTSRNRPPLLLTTNSIKQEYLSPNEVETLRLTLDIPEEDLERSGLDRKFSVEQKSHCPIRSEPQIIVRR